MAKRAIDLQEFNINFLPQPTMKAQILVDFLVECTVPKELPSTASKGNEERSLTRSEDTKKFLQWILHVDEASNVQGYGAGLILVNPNVVITEYALRFDSKASNNEVKYEALIIGLHLTKELEVKDIKVLIDS